MMFGKSNFAAHQETDFLIGDCFECLSKNNSPPHIIIVIAVVYIFIFFLSPPIVATALNI